MYALTKTYKSKAQAINAIRLTARNKEWTVLDTDAAAAHVWPAADGYTVNNLTLNVALGFVTEEQEQASGPLAQLVPEGTITDGKALEAVSAALAEQSAKDTKTPKLQAPSKMEQSKKENLAPKAKKATQEQLDHLFGKDKKVTEGDKKPTRCEVVNNARRPLRGKTLLVWETTEAMQKASGTCPSLKEVFAKLQEAEPGFNKTTCSIQFYACRTYNGWDVK